MGLLDEAKPTPRNRFLGLLADAAQSADEYANAPGAATGGKANPPLAMLADLLGVGSVARTLDRLSYGEPITNYGKANVPLIPQDTAAAAMAAIPVAQGLGRGAVATAKFAGPKAAGMAEDYMARSGLLQPATVWHGSPHKFDRFDFGANMGRGEGAQSYGHGGYLADAKEVASTYLGTGETIGGAATEGRLARAMEKATDAGRYGEALALEELLINRSPAKAISRFSEPNGGQQYKDALEAVQKYSRHFKDGGNLYKVDLPDSAISRMLDWDKPLSQQAPEVQAGLRKYMGPEWEKTWSNFQGVNAYDVIAGGRHSNPAGNIAASQKLRDAGIPGIRYLDGGSRGAGTGTSNYVVFPGEEGLLTILERNGVPLK